jgi:tetratricopeptide (TPR) repeat protein
MIAKNEEEYITECLESVKSLVDDIVIVLADDSTDKTEEIARRYNANIIRHKWNNDFSEERNLSLKEAIGDWILVLDADELVSQKDIEVIRRITEDKELSGAFLLQRNYVDDDSRPGFVENKGICPEERAKGYFDNPIIRFFRNRPDIRFEYKLHETVENSIKKIDGKILATDIPIHHYGFLRGDNQLTMKRNRCIKLGEEQIKESPNDPRHYYDLGLIYMNTKDYPKAVELFEKVKSLKRDYRDVNHNLGLINLVKRDFDLAMSFFEEDVRLNKASRSFTNLAVLYLGKKKIKEAFDLLRRALIINPNDVNALKNIAVMLATSKSYKEGETLMRRAVSLAPNDPSLYFNLAMIYANSGKRKEAVEALKKADSLGYKRKELINEFLQKLKA